MSEWGRFSLKNLVHRGFQSGENGTISRENILFDLIHRGNASCCTGQEYFIRNEELALVYASLDDLISKMSCYGDHAGSSDTLENILSDSRSDNCTVTHEEYIHTTSLREFAR